jgi:alkylation response protein AidB-like acyl-CoA dehydrogenase
MNVRMNRKGGIEMRAQVPRTQDRLFHDVFMPEEIRAVRAEIRAFAGKVVEPVAYEIGQQEEKKENFPRQVFHALAEAGIYKIPFPEQWGGKGLRYPSLATCVALEELAYVSDSIASIIDVHCILAGHALMYGSDRIKKEFLQPSISGKKIGCFATTEPVASSDLSVHSLQTKAEKKGDKWIVNGQKRFITNACVADFVAALVNTEGKLSELVIDLKAPGVRVGEPDKKIGNRGQLTSDIYFTNVEVPSENLIGEIGRGLHIALGTLTYGRLGIGATGVGMAQRAFDECVHYMKQRGAFGKKIAEYQYWQFKLAERLTQIECARNLYCKAAFRMDEGVEFPEPEAAMAKYFGTQVASEFAREAVQIFGGYGFMRKLEHDQSTYKVEEIYRDCKIAEIYEGTNEIQKWIIARNIFGKDLTG